jgi:hypothetical protein
MRREISGVDRRLTLVGNPTPKMRDVKLSLDQPRLQASATFLVKLSAGPASEVCKSLALYLAYQLLR